MSQDQQSNPGAKGSSQRGANLSADQQNQGGGQDNEKHQSQSQPKGETTKYPNGGLSRSSANDGGTIEDSQNQ